MIRTHKGMWALSVSGLAMAIAAPAMAQDSNGQDPAAAQKAVTADQLQGSVGGAQERGGTADSGEIIVTGIRASIQASLIAKKKSDMVSEVITAQDIGKFPDKNVADSLGRLTGVNVVTGSAAAGGFGENQSVSIRGTDPNLNLTLLDGHSVASGDWFVLDQTNAGRSFNFSMFPSEVVGSLEVYKSAEADIPEGGVGGTINVHSRMPLDLPSGTINLSAQGAYNDLASKWEPQVSGVASWKNKSETFGILAAGFFEKRAFRRDGQEFLGYTAGANFNGTGQTVYYPTEIGNAYFRQTRERKGGQLTAQWKPSDRLEVTATGFYTRMDANNTNTNSMAWVLNDVTNNSTPGTPGYALGAYTTHTAADGNTYLTSATFNGTTAGGGAVNGKLQDDIFRTAYSSTWVANLDAKWRPTDAITVSALGGYTKGKGATTDTEAWETYWHTGMSYAFDGKHADLSFPDLPTDTTSAAYLNNYYSWSWGGRIISPDTEAYGQLDAEMAVNNGWLKSIKIGTRITDHKHSLIDDAYSWAGNALYGNTNTIGLGTVYGGGLTPSDYSNSIAGAPGYSYSDRGAVIQELSTNGGQRFAFYPPQSFSVHERTQALYAMAKVGNDRAWRGNIGVRAVHTDLDTTQYAPHDPAVTNPAPTYNNLFGQFDAVHDSNAYWDILPSANLTYNVTDKLVARAAVAKVMSRPSYYQEGGAFSLNDTGLSGNGGGNAHLKPFRAWQYNLAGEFYYAPQALFSIDLFYLDIQNYVGSNTFTEHYCTLQHPCSTGGADFAVTRPINIPGGSNKGVEVNWQQPLKWGFGVIANFTYSDAKKKKSALLPIDGGNRTIDGNSKYTYNLTGYFENKLLSARLAYTFRSKFRSGVDRSTPMWQDDYGQLDGSVLIHVMKNLSLSFDAQNILDHKLYYFVGDPSIPRAYYDNGRTVYAGVRVTF